MPASFKQIVLDSAFITFQVGNDPSQTLKIEYYSRRTTNKTIFTVFDLQQFAAVDVEGAKKGVLDLDKMLVNLIKDWDFYEDDDYTIKVPITEERFANIDINIRAEILAAITRNARGPEA